MRVMLTGASGSVGLMTLSALLKQDNHQITVFDLDNKGNRKKLKPYLKRVKTVWGNISNYDVVKDAVRNQDAIIHLAAVIPPKADLYPDLAKRVNYLGTINLIKAIKQSSNKPILIYASSISVYGDRVSEPWIKVTDILKPSDKDYYASLKIDAEEAIRQADISFIIYRLTAIMDKPKLDPLMFHMPLNTKMEIASSHDTGHAFALTLNHLDELNNQIFNLGGGPLCRTDYQAFLSRMLMGYGFNPRHLSKRCFATKNFHCGYYADSDILNNILHFQKDSLESYLDSVALKTPRLLKLFNHLFSKIILNYMQNKSDPYQALLNNDVDAIKHYFKQD